MQLLSNFMPCGPFVAGSKQWLLWIPVEAVRQKWWFSFLSHFKPTHFFFDLNCSRLEQISGYIQSALRQLVPSILLHKPFPFDIWVTSLFLWTAMYRETSVLTSSLSLRWNIYWIPGLLSHDLSFIGRSFNPMWGRVESKGIRGRLCRSRYDSRVTNPFHLSNNHPVYIHSTRAWIN